MSTGYYDCQIVTPGIILLRFNRLVLVFFVVLSLACLLILCRLVFQGLMLFWVYFVYQLFRLISELVYVSFHLFTE